MSEGFAFPLVGGNGVLILPEIQSVNFVSGTSGWVIRKDGTAEFYQVTVRGDVIITGGEGVFIYGGAPALGNLLVALSGVAGDDSARVGAPGNQFAAGLSFPQTQIGLVGQPPYFVGTDPATGALIIQDPVGNLVTVSNGFFVDTTPGANPIGLTSGDVIQYVAATNHLFTGNIKHNAGPLGKYYFEQTAHSLTVTTGVVTILPARTQQAINSDYGSGWGALPGTFNTWTCPVTGNYRFSVDTVVIPTTAAGFIRAAINGATRVQAGSSVENWQASDNLSFGPIALNAGDTFQITIFQNTGANQNLSCVCSIQKEV